MSEIQRWDMGGDDSPPYPHGDGDWVRYADVLPLLPTPAERAVVEAMTDTELDAGIAAVEALRFMRKVWSAEEKREAFRRAVSPSVAVQERAATTTPEER